ncbi:DUF305 domain-containing protein [Rhodococcus fascians]|uniref:DUF305 domain-containing protein n=1 Tax=Rhodococcoides fascians TaxID=1828 RepID=UPI0024BA1FA5|nr:DUF305 domain-containing protein [Rhodococcus fascians]MDJ0428178.1 DUF305 domain-containing protein [Rhodococcus fascians]MDJ0469911.1 DUF305 domain-containing protein [Rhodococcus fascians]
MTESTVDSVNGVPETKRSQRTALVALAVIAVLAIGFALGFLAQNPFRNGDNSPAADSVDVGFAQDMTVHHNQAIEMAAVALTNAPDQAVKSLAFDMLTSQQNQVGQMQGWLALWDRAPISTDGYMTWMTADDSHGHSMGGMSMEPGSSDPTRAMPGMASSTELAALRQATGTDVDVMFLQLMLRHHEGGLAMMEYAQTHAQAPAVINLAKSMVATQTSESTLMKQMLAAKGAQPLPEG